VRGSSLCGVGHGNRVEGRTRNYGGDSPSDLRAAVRRAGGEPGLLDGVEHAGAREEANTEGGLERETAAPARNHVDDQLGVLPDLVLQRADIERGTVDITEQDVPGADPEFGTGITHRRTAVAAAPRLVKQKRAVLRLEGAKHGRCRLGDQHPRNGVLVIRLFGTQKKPIFLGL